MSNRLTILLILVTLQASAVARVNSVEVVEIGGIKQWISIKGSSTELPVLLFLHGGPGSSSAYVDLFSDELENYFIIVQWDQRESGNTARLNGSDRPLSVNLMESDALEMIYYLRKRFKQDQIYLMGHSWGGFLGLTLAVQHPELLKAYLAVSPMVYQLESERLSLEWMIGKAKSENNRLALSQLESIKLPFQNGDQLFMHRSWLAKGMGTKPPTREYVSQWSEKWLETFNAASAVNFMRAAPEIKCPVYFFIGGKDYQTHFQLAEQYYDSLKADKKQLFWFEDSGHNLILTEPKKFQRIVIREIMGEVPKQ